MNTCDTCKFWEASDFSQDPDEQKRIQEIQITTRNCMNPKLDGNTDGRGKLLDPKEARPEAADEHGIGFVTGAKFGCIHHEKP